MFEAKKKMRAEMLAAQLANPPQKRDVPVEAREPHSWDQLVADVANLVVRQLTDKKQMQARDEQGIDSPAMQEVYRAKVAIAEMLGYNQHGDYAAMEERDVTSDNIVARSPEEIAAEKAEITRRGTEAAAMSGPAVGGAAMEEIWAIKRKIAEQVNGNSE
jgi:hypothetical protein